MPKPAHTLGLWLGLMVSCTTLFAQNPCPQLFDGFGLASNNPYYISCNNQDFTIYIQSPDTLGAYTINWGDGNSTSGTGLLPTQFDTHTYAATIDTFNVSIYDALSGCTINGVVVMEEPVNASIQIPLGGVTQVCAPHAIEFVNSSTDVSPTTTFTWNFGDGTPPITFDESNAGDTLSHTYQKNTVSCETMVTLEAENYCSFGNPTQAQFFPIMVWDVDTAAIAASETVLCYPDTVVSLTNVTKKNCLPEGNVAQRYEYWNFGDYWGKGYDSIVNWRPFDPPARPAHIMAYPGIGTYNAMLIDSNQCGRDTAYITIQIVAPTTAGIALSEDTICAGEKVKIFNQSANTATAFYWDYDKGAGWQARNGNTKTVKYNNAGTYNPGIIATIAGAFGDCADTAFAPLVVLPSPVANFSVDSLWACDSLEVQIADSAIDAVSYSWTLGNGQTSTAASPPAQFYSGVGTYTIEQEVTNFFGCKDEFSIDIDIFETPNANFVYFDACDGDSVYFDDNSTHYPSDPITSYFYNFGDSTSSSAASDYHLYADTGFYQVTHIVSTATCADTIDQSLTIHPNPTADYQVNTYSGCSPLTVNFTNTSNLGSTYLWIFGDGDSSTSIQTSHTFYNPNTYDTVYQTRLIVTSAFGCTDTIAYPITVFGIPNANFTSNALPTCAPYPVSFVDQSIAATNWYWDFDDGDTSLQQNVTHTFNNTGLFISTYNVQLAVQSNNGCWDTITQAVTVYPEPNFQFNPTPDSGCSPLDVTFPAMIGAVSYTWDFGDGTTGTGQAPSHTYVNPGLTTDTFQVELVAMSAFGCADTTYKDVIVYPSPSTQLNASQINGCSPLTVIFSQNSTGATSYAWNFDDGSTDNTANNQVSHIFTNTGSQPIDFDVELMVSTVHGCSDTASVTITVYPEVEAAYSADTIGCEPLVVNFNNQSIGASSYLWNLGNNNQSTLQNPQATYSAQNQQTTYYTALLSATSVYGCSDTTSKTIAVNNTPIAGFTPSVLAGCAPVDIPIANTSIAADFLDWSFGDGTTSNSTAPSITHLYSNNSSAPAIMTITQVASTVEGCADTIAQDVTIYPEVEASIAADSAICSPTSVQFTNNSQGATQFVWDLDNGSFSTQPNPIGQYSYTGSTSGYHTITLVATSPYQCADTASHTLHVYPNPNPQFIASPTLQTWPSNVVNLTNTTVGLWNWSWTFGDGQTTTVQHPNSVSYNAPGSYDISLSVSNQHCSATVTTNIVILPPPPIASFVGSGEGCEPLTVQFTNQSEHATSYLWDFGDGNTSTAQNPLYTYHDPGLFDVTLSVTGPNGTDTYTITDAVRVHPKAIARFEFQPGEVAVPNETVTFFNLSTNSSYYFWDFGDGSTSEDHFPEHQYGEIGEFYPMLIANNDHDCPDTAYTEIPVVGIGTGEINFPNAFIPDPSGPTGGYLDGINYETHIFYPMHSGVVYYHLTIYNRWGEMVFETYELNQGWDGYYRGRMSPQDAYVWKAEVTFVDGRTESFIGDVTLLQ